MERKKAVNTAAAVVIVQYWHKGTLNLYSKLHSDGGTTIPTPIVVDIPTTAETLT